MTVSSTLLLGGRRAQPGGVLGALYLGHLRVLSRAHGGQATHARQCNRACQDNEAGGVRAQKWLGCRARARPALLDKVRNGYVACVEAQGASARGAQRRAGLLGSECTIERRGGKRQSRDLQPCFIGRASKLQQVWSDDRGGRMAGAVRRRGLSRRWGRSRSSLKSPANPDARGDSVTSRFRHGGR